MSPQPLWLEQEAVNLPSNRDWLGPAEREHLASLEIEKRRQDWLLGRWTAKQTLFLASALEASAVDHPSQLEILPADDGSPRVLVSGVPVPISLSLSHRAGRALCCVWAGGSVGCDLELVEPRSRAFIEDYFTAAEQALIEGARSEGATVVANGLWSAKESVLKLLQVGLTVDSRLLEVQGASDTPTPEWQRITVLHKELSRSFPGWWRRRGQWILTVATETETGSPVRLSIPEEGGRVPAP